MSGERELLAAALVDSNMLHRSDPFRWDFADALLPVVDRIANERAAAEVRAVVDVLQGMGLDIIAARYRARAAALDPS